MIAPHILLPHHLSGSYGLAEGSDLTNGDTAILVFEFIRSGGYYFDSANTGNRQNFGYVYTSNSFNQPGAYYLYYDKDGVDPEKISTKSYGWNVHC